MNAKTTSARQDRAAYDARYGWYEALYADMTDRPAAPTLQQRREVAIRLSNGEGEI